MYYYRCGIVALSMAYSIENIDFNYKEMLYYAISIGITKSGEIFSGFYQIFQWLYYSIFLILILVFYFY